ncbi:DUF3833 domain-containing protein [Desulfuromonas sp. AOP6]|uniref:DUF3833 domain-containing protein n=1 Tax=Desulfuromonas sp. AOP6 TaxID=1566351 RepID=UPI00127704EE|nr:DUF3833 domain-containing protein [Desulfuromonas sp. AOP6]BCA79301.1 hypothetical protein AOP6_1088 [Desulfuromonas sp. AOP6]
MKSLSSILCAAFLLIFLLPGCASVTVSDYEGRTPELVLETFFDGPLTAHGVVKNRSGKVIRYFTAEIRAWWDGPVGTLDETFVFDDGEVQRRLWKLTREGKGRYTGTANDVVGTARGEVAGNSFFMEYVLEVPYRGKSLEVTIDDRMYLVSPGVLVNESEMRKFGIRVGEILLVILK